MSSPKITRMFGFLPSFSSFASAATKCASQQTPSAALLSGPSPACAGLSNDSRPDPASQPSAPQTTATPAIIHPLPLDMINSPLGKEPPPRVPIAPASRPLLASVELDGLSLEVAGLAELVAWR